MKRSRKSGAVQATVVEPAATTTPAASQNSARALNYAITMRLKLYHRGGTLAKALAVIAEVGGDTGAIDTVEQNPEFTIRDISVNVSDKAHADALEAKLKTLQDVEFINSSDPVFLKHLGGKITVVPRVEIKTRHDLSQVYTPGVAQVCKAIHADPCKAYTLTMKGNMVAVITNGTRVLSLGDIGPKAALPVMEGKAMLFKKFAGVDAFPICLDSTDTEEMIRIIKAVAPGFGAINLEDIASPGCYEIEDRLRDELDIPVFHDDQHATAIVVAAAAINAAKLVKKPLSRLKVVACGVGAAGLACVKLLIALGVKNVVGYNANGAVYKGKEGLTEQEQWLAENSNPKQFKGSMKDALKGADMFLGLSVGGVLKGEDLKVMARDAIVFALANPTPEVMPEDAAPFVRVMATGGSNYPNQINNALVFPGIFRGALDARVPNITEEMKIEAARALAAVVSKTELHEDYIIPSVFDPRVAKAVAGAVVKVAQANGARERSCNKHK